MIQIAVLIPLIWIIFFVSGYSQSTNEEIFVELMVEFNDSNKLGVGSLSGFTTVQIDSIYPSNAEILGELTISEPGIQFKRVKKGMYSRYMGFGVSYSDSTSQEFFLERSDTIHRSQIKLVRKSVYKPLRGESPLMFQTVVMPILGIAAGISVFVTLFNVRS